MSQTFEEPSIPAVPARLRRPLAAMWISLTVHAAVIGLVQVAPPAAPAGGAPVIEARLLTPARPDSTPDPAIAEPAPVLPAVPETTPPVLALSPLPDPLPAARPQPVEPVPAAAAPVEPVSASPARAEASAPPSAPAAEPAPATVITSSVDLNYYSAREVDVQAKPMRDFDLKYLEEVAYRQRLSGKMRLRLKIEADGRVSGMELISATHPELYDESKLKAMRDMPFFPAQKNGRPVREIYVLEVEYNWLGRSH